MFDFSKLEQNILSLPEKIEIAAEKYGKTVAAKLEGEAKENRPWRDRTAQARQRIKGRCEKEPGKLKIYLSHGVDYGVYLEFAHEKRYAIIYPTLRKEAPEVMSGMRGLIDKL